MRLWDSAGTILQFDDDGGSGFNSQMTVAIQTTGAYFIDADSYSSAYAGDYELTIEAVARPTPVDAI